MDKQKKRYFGIKHAFLSHLEKYGDGINAELEAEVVAMCKQQANPEQAAAYLLAEFGYKPTASQLENFPNIIKASTFGKQISQLKHCKQDGPRGLILIHHLLTQFLHKEGKPAPANISEFMLAEDIHKNTYQVHIVSGIGGIPQLDTTEVTLSQAKHWRILLGLGISISIALVNLWYFGSSHNEATPQTVSLRLAGEMVKLPGKRYTLGCSSNTECEPSELPSSTVVIKPFLLGKTEVTFAAYDQFCEETNTPAPEDNTWGRGERPVINVDWYDVERYIEWLNNKTGEHFRLPTEAEWEYAARADSEHLYSWGDLPDARYANGDESYGWPDDGFQQSTAPVASFKANQFGLFDMHGNVREWLGDCWHNNYQNVPANGNKPWRENDAGDCTRRVTRGGGWKFLPTYLRTSSRSWNLKEDKNNYTGFRLAKDL